MNNLTKKRLVGAFGAIGGGAIGYAILTYFAIASKYYLPFALVLAIIGAVFLTTAIVINTKKLCPGKQ